MSVSGFRPCGFTVVDDEGEQGPCDRPADSWRWYQDVEHEDGLEVACTWHENAGGIRLHNAEANLSDYGRLITQLAQDWGDKCCDNPDQCACTMAQAVRFARKNALIEARIARAQTHLAAEQALADEAAIQLGLFGDE